MRPASARGTPTPAQSRHEHTDDGFTLVELLVVITILGILSAIVVFAVSGLGDKGKAAAVRADAQTLATAEEAHCAKSGHYADIATLHEAGLLASANSGYNSIALGSAGKCGTGPNSSYVINGVTDVTQTVGAPIDVGAGPTDIDIDAVLNKIYVLNTTDSTVSVIDATSKTVTATIPIAPAVALNDRLVVNARNKLVYVTVGGLTGVVAIDETTNTLLGSLATATGPGASAPLVAGANSSIVVDPSSGDAYAWAQDAATSRAYLLRYGADPTTTAPAVIDPSAGLPNGLQYQFASSATLENVPTVVDPGRAVYQIGVVGSTRYWLAVDLAAHDAITLTPFTDLGGRDLAGPFWAAGAFAAVDPTTHVVSATIQYLDANSSLSSGFARLTNGTTAAARVDYPLLNDFTDPATGALNAEGFWYPSLSVPVTFDPFSRSILVFGQPDTGANDSNADPQDQITILDSGFHRISTTGNSLGVAQDPFQFAEETSGIMQKTLVVNPTNDRAYFAAQINPQPAGGVGLGGLTSFSVGSSTPTTVNTGTKYSALVVDPANNLVYATEYVGGTVVVFT